ncbi:asparagine synthase (glutamine-hydrolyzing) [Fluviicola sp.]|jgi:asparagine synthase (glutamine-hydrolysing)|uniref:asparagine synthase (glutamine-hydrolyzing) n=1 Tax=Fluviicola sp. TaxID=1917219 RepID=UPI00283A0C2A|nr:asparagine synthase (glutamine-hydrolyzing) [Fluviicola sp.]MDR0801733.1 asparagine synthase (glutamine-hydrolyzing) [Fluviicola sp.]
MCGIAGIITPDQSEMLLTRLKAMTDSIAHRGPDGEGHWICENKQIAFGHRRLAIIDLSENGKQPMHYLERYTITFNGEIYNYPEIREQLIQQGYTFQSQTDTEVLLALYDLKKEYCLQDLDGMFAFAIFDKQENQVFCARDRFGEKPFYYTHLNGTFYFASEMKALWAAEVPKIPSRQRIFDYLAFDRMESAENPESTFFERIFQLKPAHYIFIDLNQLQPIKQQNYWKADLSKKSALSFEEAQQEFKRLLTRSVERRLRSDVPVGSSLSGGLDSSAIVALICQLKSEGQDQHTFSARFPSFKKDEGAYIDRMTNLTNSQSHAVFCTEEMLNETLPHLFRIHEEPFGSTSIAAQFLVMKLAKESSIKVLLDGQGADEYLAGYSFFYLNYAAELRALGKSALTRFQDQYQKHFNTQFITGRTFWIDAKYPNLRDAIRKLKNKTKKPAYFKQFSSDFLETVQTNNYKTGFRNSLNEALMDALTKNSLRTLLRYADRNSMANSREVRLPFLSHELVEFVFSLPSSYKIHEIWTKAILRYSLNDLLPVEVTWRKEKIGFEPPNYKTVDETEVSRAIQCLVENKILNSDKVIPSKYWEYVQVAHLYDK